MAKKQSTSKVPAPIGHVLYKRLTPCESRILAAFDRDKKMGQTPSKK